MRINTNPQCSCGLWFRTMRDLNAHISDEGGSQSHTLFCYVSPKTGEWVDVHPRAKEQLG